MGAAENFVVRQIKEYCSGYEVFADFPMIEEIKLFRTNNFSLPNRKSLLPIGFPDFSGYVKVCNISYAIPIFVEAKANGKSILSKEQKEFLEKARADKCIAFFANSLDNFKNKLMEQIKEIFSKKS